MQAGSLLEVDLHLTNRCNLTCAHCSVDSGRSEYDELNTEQWLAVVDQAADLGCRYADLTGGEALLHAGASAIVQRVVERGMHVELQTNGLIATEVRLKPLIAAGLRDIIISVDGPEAVHDQVRGRRGVYTAAKTAIELAVRLGLRVRVTRVAMDSRSEDDLPAFVAELERMGVSKLSINQFSPVVARHFGTWQPRDPQAWFEVTRTLDRLAGTTTLKLSYEVGYVTPEEWPAFSTDETQCLIRRRKWFVVRCDGEVFPCYHFFHRREMSLGNVSRARVADIVGRGNWNAYSRMADPPEACASCSFSTSCHGGCPSPGYLRMGDLALRDPRCHVEDGFVPVCPFVKRTAGASTLTNIAPYYARTSLASDSTAGG